MSMSSSSSLGGGGGASFFFSSFFSSFFSPLLAAGAGAEEAAGAGPEAAPAKLKKELMSLPLSALAKSLGQYASTLTPEAATNFPIFSPEWWGKYR